jgi:hypothetical protein
MKAARLALVPLATLGLAGTGLAQAPSRNAIPSPKVALSRVCSANALIGSANADISEYVVSPGTPAAVRNNVDLTVPAAAAQDNIPVQLRIIALEQRYLPPLVRRQTILALTAYVREFAPVATLARATAPAGKVPKARYARFAAAQALSLPIYKRTLGTLPC